MNDTSLSGNTRSVDHITLRLPEGLRDQIKRAAGENNRSMNGEIVARLERDDTTLRDRIAMAALSGLVSVPQLDTHPVILAYEYADIALDIRREAS